MRLGLVQGLTVWAEQSLQCASRCPASQSDALGHHPSTQCLSFPSQLGEWQDGCVGTLGERRELRGLWLQVPRPVTEEEHEPPDRVRLPRSLFESLQDSSSVVRLAITLLDIGPGNLFKVRRGLMEAQGSSVGQCSVHQGPVPQLALSRVFAVGPNGDGGGDEPPEKVSKAAQGHPRLLSSESVHCKLALVTHTQMFGPHAPVSLVGPVRVSQAFMSPCVSLWMYRCTYSFRFLVCM